jgi:hypothetical protein
MSYFVLLQAHFGNDYQVVKAYNPNANNSNLLDLDLIKLKLQNPQSCDLSSFANKINKYFKLKTHDHYY